mgnify:CR=1 FL=1
MPASGAFAAALASTFASGLVSGFAAASFLTEACETSGAGAGASSLAAEAAAGAGAAAAASAAAAFFFAASLSSLEVLDPELCPRYLGRVLLNVKVGPSPQWLKHRLMAAGQRPINNIVDIG